MGKIDNSNGISSFKIISGNPNEAFNIDNDGTIKVNTSTALDYEAVELIELEIEAITDADCESALIVLVAITITDLADEIYRDPVFSNISIDENVVYGEVEVEEQIMKVYAPEDNNRRPLLVIAVGGGMSFGHLEGLGNSLSKAGYVVATIRYRPASSTEDPTLRNIKAAQDLKAAIRYFRRDADTDDKYKINVNNIFAGGFGFGAFTVYRAAYTTEEDVTAEVLAVIEENGGFEGKRGNEGYSSQFKAVVALSGGIDDLNYIDNGENPLIAIHSLNDPEVPCEMGQYSNGSPYWGSCAIIDKATQVGIANSKVLIDSNDHDATVACAQCYDEILKFFYGYLE